MSVQRDRVLYDRSLAIRHTVEDLKADRRLLTEGLTLAQKLSAPIWLTILLHLLPLILQIFLSNQAATQARRLRSAPPDERDEYLAAAALVAAEDRQALGLPPRA